MKKVNREHIMNITTPADERSEKEGQAREPRELSSEELESIIGGVGVELSVAASNPIVQGLKPYTGSVVIGQNTVYS